MQQRKNINWYLCVFFRILTLWHNLVTLAHPDHGSCNDLEAHNFEYSLMIRNVLLICIAVQATIPSYFLAVLEVVFSDCAYSRYEFSICG